MKALRSFVALAFVWCALVEVAEFLAGRLFGMELDGDWFLLATGSSTAAMSEFLRLYAVPLAFGMAVFLGLMAVLVVAAFRLRLRVVLLLFAVYACVGYWRFGSLRAWKPLYVAYDTLRSARLYSDIAAAGRWTPERAAAMRLAAEGATNLVFVIGESMTTARLSFFGYGKRTTPRMESLGGALSVQGPFRAPSPYTVLALAHLFETNGCSAAVRLRQAGYHTALVSAHDRWARYCSVESSIFEACERRIHLTEISKGRHVYDDELLPYVEELVKREPFAIFIHMMGSHFHPSDRVRPGYLADEGLDDYDRSIRFSDEVLYGIIRALPPRTVLYYVSDHGESVDRPGWRDFGSPALWSVPVFAYPAAAARTLRDLSGFADLWYNLP